jgi:hypothetical protein
MKMCKVCILVLAISVTSLSGVTYGLTIDGSDAIYLAGRTDITVPDAGDLWTFLTRHGGDTPEEIQETHPPCIPVVECATVNIVSATGGINFFNGYGPPYYSPSGNGTDGSDLDAIDGISGYKGPEGPLAGVFLDDSIPDTGPAPATLDFTLSGLGTDFLTLSPELGQVFYIGDGLTSLLETQDFIAPAGATRLCLGIPDGFGFDGHPGAYDDNDGSYEVEVKVLCETAYAYSDAEPSTCFSDLGLGFSNWGWTIYLADEDEYVLDLYAGAGQCDTEKGTFVGTVTVDYSGGTVDTTFSLEPGHALYEAHVYAGASPVPVTKKGKATVAPGQYYIEPDLEGEIYVIVHAVVCSCDE